MALPVKYLAKLCTHKIKVKYDTYVDVMIAANEDLVKYESAVGYYKVVEFGVNELKSNMGECNVVGLAVMDTGPYNPNMLLLSVGSYCLVIKLQRLNGMPQSLIEFLKDPKIHFVGGDHMPDDLLKLRMHGLETKYGIPAMELVKLVQKIRPTSAKFCDEAILDMLSLEEPPNIDFKLDAPTYSEREIHFLIHKVYEAFLFGKVMLDEYL